MSNQKYSRWINSNKVLLKEVIKRRNRSNRFLKKIYQDNIKNRNKVSRNRFTRKGSQIRIVKKLESCKIRNKLTFRNKWRKVSSYKNKEHRDQKHTSSISGRIRRGMGLTLKKTRVIRFQQYGQKKKKKSCMVRVLMIKEKI